MSNGSDPDVKGPFADDAARDAEARRLHGEAEGDEDGDVIMWANVGPGVKLEMEAYSRAFFDGEEEEDAEAA